MLEVILFFRRLIRLPYDMVMGPLNLANSNWRESSRQQALMLGIPAIFIAVVGLTTLGVSQVNRQERLEPWYLSLQEKTSREKISVQAELNRMRIVTSEISDVNSTRTGNQGPSHER